MSRRTLTTCLAVLALAPTVLLAQNDGASSRSSGRGQVRVFSFNRARLGVTVQTKADSETDRYGARIQSVMEDSPAEKAGLKAGDIVTRFNSTSLAAVKPDGDHDSDMSGPGLKLVELAQEMKGGDTVKVEYRRDGASHSATIVVKEGDDDMATTFRMPDMREFESGPQGQFRFFGGEPGTFQFNGPGAGNMGMFMGTNFGLQLIEVNNDLGEYFGTSEGLLVAQAPQDSTMPLRAGDVILAIDGRKPTSVEHAMRILRSYEQGESVKIDIMRKRQRSTIDWKVSEPRRMRSTRPSGMLMPAREAMPTRSKTQL